MEIKKLISFDFDDTLVHTTLPAEGKVIWKEKTGEEWPYRAWWSKPESLDMEVFDIPLNKKIYRRYQQAISDPNNYVILATGRVKPLQDEVNIILNHYGLEFDEMHLNPGIDTFEFKSNLFAKLIYELQPEEFIMYDDRQEHLIRFVQWAKEIPCKITIMDAISGEEFKPQSDSLQENIQRIKEIMGVEHNPKKIILEETITGELLSSDQGFVDYLKRVEGFKDKAYDDQDPNKIINAGDTIKGVLTIGYGHTGSDVKPGDTISEEDATIKLKKDIDIHFDRAYQYVSTNYPGRENKLNLEQWEMLTDFAFNPGLGKFPKFAKAVIYKNWNLAVKEYKRFFNGSELTNRNSQFYSLFLVDKDTSYKELGKGKNAANNVTTADGKPLDQTTYCLMLDGAPQNIAWIGKIMRYAEYYVEANKLKNNVDLTLNTYIKRHYPELTNIGVTPENWTNPTFCKT